MFTGGTPASGPAASGEQLAVSEASDGLLTDALDAITALMKPCKRKGMRKCGPECAVHVQCAVLDKEEMLGYYLGDLFGLPKIPKLYARSVGETARLRATKAAPAIHAAQRRYDKAAPNGMEVAAAELSTLRSRVQVELQLPSVRQCDGAAAGSKRQRESAAAPAAPDAAVHEAGALAAWCRRMGRSVDSIERARNERRLNCAVYSRWWRPRTVLEEKDADHDEYVQKREDDLCFCSEPGVQSFLCRVTRCYATAATGQPCEQRSVFASSGAGCDCMIDLTLRSTHDLMRSSRYRPRRERAIPWDMEEGIYGCFEGPPGGLFGAGFCGQRAGDSLPAGAVRALRDRELRTELLEEYPRFGLHE